MPTFSGNEVIQTGQDIAPYESVICEILTEQIRAISSAESEMHKQGASFSTLEEVLRRAATTIRYNAKWFAERTLVTLLEIALNAAATSSASADLYATVNLIDTVIIYSLLPPQCLPQAVRFLSQTYYSATRAHKTKRLADSDWSTLQHILESHLGPQAVVALLDVVCCGDEAGIESRIGYAQVAGALMIISEKMLLKDDLRDTIPTPSLTQLLDSLWFTVVNGNNNIREVIMEILPVLLTDEHVVSNLDAESSWETLLDTVEPCVTLTPNTPAAKSLVEILVLRVDRFESRKLPIIAHLAIDLDLPLTAQLSQSIIAPSEDVLPSRDTPNAFCRLLERLSRSSLYIVELEMLVGKAVVEIFLRIPERKSFVVFVRTLQDLVINAATTAEAADIIAKAVVTMFRHSVRFTGRDWEKKALFQALCEMSTRCMPAAEALFSIRADVEGAVYVESGLHSQTFPAHSTSSSVTAVMHDASSLSLQNWHNVILAVLQGSAEWNVYHYFLAEIPLLLGNHTLFDERIDFVERIRAVVCELLDSGQYPEPPVITGLTKSHVAMGLVQILTAALSYYRRLSKQKVFQTVSMFLKIAGSRDHIVSTPCIHALTICCYELPDLMASYMDDVIDKMSKMVTQRHLAIHVLYFLAGLSLHPGLFHNFQTHDYKKIFGVCGSYLQSIRGTSFLTDRHQPPSSDQSSRTSADSTEALPQHVYALANHVIAFWYLALKSHDRLGLKEFITSCLRYKTGEGHQIVEDQGLVTIDLMDRIDAKDAQAEADNYFDYLDGRLTIRHRLSGMLLITTETALRNGKTILTVRRATGTDKWSVVASPRNVKEQPSSVSVTVESGEDDYLCIFAEDIDGHTFGRVYIPPPTSLLGSERILNLPNDETVTRAIQSFDRTSALDSHKAGVIYIGEGQTTEDEILQNQMGSPEYVEFAMSLGSLENLKGATFNTQGLDRMNDADGRHAIVWHGQVTELVFHITTLMPNSEDVSLNTVNKKRHIGNDYVNIIFNNSGAPFDFDTFPSQFSLVYIVITPSARTSFIQSRTQSTATEKKDRFYAVQVLTRPAYPTISTAAEEKIISGTSLPGYVRNLAFNECIFSSMWAYKDDSGEYPSSWRSRLHQIRRLWERYSS